MPREGGKLKQKGISEKKRKKGSQNGGIEGEKGELEGFFKRESEGDREGETDSFLGEKKR